MENFLKKYLFRQATLFPWIGLLFFNDVLAIVVHDLLSLIKGQVDEGVLMSIMYIVGGTIKMIIFFIMDYVFRKIFKNKLKLVWAVEIILVLAFTFFYAYNYLWRTLIITKNTTPLITVVENTQSGVALKRSLLHLQTTLDMPADNILVITDSFVNKEFNLVSAKTKSGYKYRQAYFMQFGVNAKVNCNGNNYRIHFFQLDSNAYPYFRMNDVIFDSICKEVCKKLDKK